MLEVKGELVFKTVAYHRAADAIGRSPVDLVAAYRGGTPPRIPGVGAAISDKIAELATTGQHGVLRAAQDRDPARARRTCCASPASGPRPSASSTRTLGIASMDDLRAAAEGGRLRDLRGLSAKTEALVLEGIARLDADPGRMLLDKAETRVDRGHRRHRRHARRPPARTGRLVPPPQGVDRRPRHPRRDRRRGHAHRAGSRRSASVDHVVNQGGSQGRRPSACAARRWT